MGKIKIPGKKGMMTLSALLIASALLFLVAAVSLYSNSLKSNLIPLSDLEKINAQYDAISYGASRILIIEAVNITRQGKNITFEENLTLPSGYAEDMARFKQFAENNTLLGRGNLNATINITQADNPWMYILPQNIGVNHPANNRVVFTPQNTAQSAGDVNGYVLYIRINENVPRIRWNRISEVPSTDPNALFFGITVVGNLRTRTDTRYLNKSALSQARINGGATKPSITINIDSPAKLDLTYSSGVQLSEYTNMSLNTTIRLNGGAYVELGQNIINTTQGKEIENLGPVIILER